MAMTTRSPEIDHSAHGVTSRRSRRYELIGPRRGRLSRHEPTEPGPGEVLVRVHASGVCASELDVWSGPATEPQQLGHEPVGIVAAVGAGVDLAEGTPVTGRFGPSFADHVLADVHDVVPVPPSVPLDQALGEPLGCVVEGWRRTPLPPGAQVAVIGLGFMGQAMVQLLARSAVARLAAIDLRDDARTLSSRFGADETYHPDALPLGAKVDSSTPHSSRHGFDVVFDVTGTQAGLDLATTLVRPHGCLSILGYHRGERRVDMQLWNWKAIDVVNAHVRDRHLLRASTAAALELLAAGRIDMSSLITHRFRLDQVDEAFAALAGKPLGFVKAVVRTD
jgi:threonine dehydrogenase-like Zn-dependent dehydrogenase